MIFRAENIVHSTLEADSESKALSTLNYVYFENGSFGLIYKAVRFMSPLNLSVRVSIIRKLLSTVAYIRVCKYQILYHLIFISGCSLRVYSKKFFKCRIKKLTKVMANKVINYFDKNKNFTHACFGKH